MNDWIKSTGEFYIDIDKAVTGGGASWYPGFVQSDGIHPSLQGHAAIFAQAKLDVPFLFQI